MTQYKQRPLLFILSTLALWVSGCASSAPASSADQSAIDANPELTVEGETPGSASYYLLLAEMAREKDLFDIAADNYLKAAYVSDDPEIAKRATQVAYELGRNDTALKAAKRWATLAKGSDKYPQVHTYLARLYVRAGNPKNAARELSALLELSDADKGDSMLALSAVLADEEKRDVVAQTFQRLVKKHRRLPQSHYIAGLHALRSGEYDRSKNFAKAATKLEPDWVPAHLLYARTLIAEGDVEAGIDYAGEYVGGTSRVGERLEYGMLLAAVDRDIEASMVLGQVLSDEPGNAPALRALGLLDLKAGDLAMAERRFSALLQSGQGTFDAFYYLGGIAEANKQDQRAYRLYSEVRAGDNAVVSQLRAAYILARTDRLDEALKHLERFANDHPRHSLEMALGQGEIMSDFERQDEALMLYNNILDQNPDERRAMFSRAFLLEKMDRIDDAIHQMRIILAADPTDANALNALGYTLADRTDQLEEAFELISLAHAKSPKSGPIVDSLGWVEYKRGNFERAAELLEQAFELLPDGEVLAHLLEVSHTLGNSERVDELLELANGDYAEDAKVLETRSRLGL